MLLFITFLYTAGYLACPVCTFGALVTQPFRGKSCNNPFPVANGYMKSEKSYINSGVQDPNDSFSHSKNFRIRILRLFLMNSDVLSVFFTVRQIIPPDRRRDLRKGEERFR